ncbi:hypothetical protein PFISCL1PPCAC_25126, partial [Pristionchus fissidentatus]
NSLIQEYSYFFISLAIFFSQSLSILILIFYFYFYVISLNIRAFLIVFNLMLYTSDIFSLSPGIYTLIVPGPIRRKCLSTLPNCMR